MPTVSRRHALQAVAVGIAGLAGCSDTTETTQIEPRSERRSLTDYDAHTVRDTNGRVLFSYREELPEATGDHDRVSQRGRSVIVTDEGLDRLTFAANDPATSLREFVGRTDFSQASIYLLAMPLKACYSLQLTSVSIDADELQQGDLHPHADFCRTYRPADEECETGIEHTVGVAIRLPIAAEDSSGSGRGMSNSCDRSGPRVEPFDPNGTAVTERGSQ